VSRRSQGHLGLGEGHWLGHLLRPRS
jgi:hypothetical protein